MLQRQTAETLQTFKMIANIRTLTATENSMPADAIFLECRSRINNTRGTKTPVQPTTALLGKTTEILDKTVLHGMTPSK